MNLDRVLTDIRQPLSQVEKPSQKQLKRIDATYDAQPVEFPEPGGNTGVTRHNTQNELTDYQGELLEWIHQWLAEHPEYEYITASKCHRPSGAPGNPTDTSDQLEAMVEKDVLDRKDKVERSGNYTVGYKPVEQ